MKKIALVIPSLQAGGMERVMSELGNYFSQKEDIEVHLILYGISRQKFYQVSDRVKIHKPEFDFNNKLRLFSAIRTLRYLRCEIQRIKPDSVLSFGEYWNSFVLLALVFLNVPVYVSDRCQPDKSLGRLHDILRKLFYPRASGIIVQTQKAKKIYDAGIKHHNIEVIGNPIRSIRDEGSITRENIVLMVGRLIKTKHQDKLIESFAKISKPAWKLVLVGYDHLQQNNSEKLRKIIVDNHVEDSVVLVGKQADVEAFYLKSKIFAFTSSSEGFPNVIGEAMSGGIPAVAFDCVAGPSEMINNNHDGFLIPLFNYEQFQEKLKTLMDDEILRARFGQNASESIKKYSIEIIGEKFLHFILNKSN